MNFSGSTALCVAADAQGSLYCASLGDCRAVLCRGGQPLVLSAPEHKAARKDEVARVVGCGVRGGHVCACVCAVGVCGECRTVCVGL
jgi:hypothetical protein